MNHGLKSFSSLLMVILILVSGIGYAGGGICKPLSCCCGSARSLLSNTPLLQELPACCSESKPSCCHVEPQTAKSVPVFVNHASPQVELRLYHLLVSCIGNTQPRLTPQLPAHGPFQLECLDRSHIPLFLQTLSILC